MDRPSTVSAILDPRNKLSVFTDQSVACEHIQSIYETFKERSSSFTTDSQIARTPRRTRQYFAKLRCEASRAEIVRAGLPKAETARARRIDALRCQFSCSTQAAAVRSRKTLSRTRRAATGKLG